MNLVPQTFFTSDLRNMAQTDSKLVSLNHPIAITVSAKAPT